jgi:hypothetical protein
MSKMRIESKPGLEAYIREDGNICLRQEGSDGKDNIIIIPREHAGKVINWLQILVDEKRGDGDTDFIAED